ncbi:hypothetical protein [Sphingomonas sanxanigenens]|uniref:Uncharacterized protein n=1 Tax=Sphingomonas sanxanigenens DSM 19645 = NX02 TaxID=1123269 RepID=W0A8E4_9SPHN|nr:hypothetical protein [Sphingomonas sanxanigenens]AHE52752.1 hypothetical protein NX02_05055 [Sphingomonas sanxanigenens DSM 19645 = NX02]
MRRPFARAVAGLAMVGIGLTAPALAEKPPVFVTTAPVKDKPAVTLDPAQGYMLVRAPTPVALYFVREPSAADQATYDALRKKALAESHAKYQKKRAAYDNAKIAAAKPNSTIVVPEEPVEPTEANFEFTPFAMMAGVQVGALNRFGKQADGSTYVQAVTPGTYRLYGPMTVLPGGAVMGTCLCMGSVKFDVAAGAIVDLGDILLTPQTTTDRMLNGVQLGIVPPAADRTNDPRLAALPIRPARFKPAGKLPNYFGLGISRLAAIPGVMRYERDNIVDLTAAN